MPEFSKMRKNIYRISGMILLICVTIFIASCVPNDKFLEPYYTGNVFPNSDNVWLGSSIRPFDGVVSYNFVTWNGTDWTNNFTGPQGLTGAKGDTGATGAKGDTGAAGSDVDLLGVLYASSGDQYVSASNSTIVEFSSEIYNTANFTKVSDTTFRCNNNGYYDVLAQVSVNESVSTLSSINIYPDAHPESTTVDGDVRRITTSESWSSLVNGAGTSPLDDSGNIMYIYFSSSSTSNQYRWLMRSILLFDTTLIPDDAVIISAGIYVYADSKDDQLGIASNWKACVYGSTPTTNTALVNTDYSHVQAVEYSSSIPYNSIATGAYNYFALNSNGIVHVDKQGITKFSLRESYYDVGGVAPAWSSNKDTGVTFDTADKGTIYRPYLNVQYVVGYVLKQLVVKVNGTNVIGESESNGRNLQVASKYYLNQNDYLEIYFYSEKQLNIKKYDSYSAYLGISKVGK